VEQNSLSAAVLDFRGGDGDADALCAKLIAQNIPFVKRIGEQLSFRNRGVGALITALLFAPRASGAQGARCPIDRCGRQPLK
jgi:hypothetical protein